MILQMDKSRQEQRELRQKQEEQRFNKLLLWIVAALVYEAVVMFVKRYYVNYRTTMLDLTLARAVAQTLVVLKCVAPILTLAAALWGTLWLRKKRSVRLPAVLFGVFAALSATAILFRDFDTLGVTLAGILPALVAGLAVVYYIYQQEFFYNSIVGLVGILTVWMLRKVAVARPVFTLVLCLVVLVFLVVATVLNHKVCRNDGMLGKVRVLESDATYRTGYLTIAFTAFAVVAAWFFGSAVAYYAMFALIGWLFCLVVYYTVRMM